MNTELLRDDERELLRRAGSNQYLRRQIRLLSQRLIEERENNEKIRLDFVEAFEAKFIELRQRAEKAEGELAKSKSKGQP